MAVNISHIRCKSCAQVLATVLPTGLVPKTSSDTWGCSTCQQFDTLYNAVQAADTEWAGVESKRDTLKAKQIALEKHKKVHMEFDNWLISVEAPAEPKGTKRKACDRETDVEERDIGDEQHQQGIKRARSHSPTSQPPEQDPVQHEFSEPQPLHEKGLSLSLRPSPKRSRSTTSLSERKRIKFSDSVEFREIYRHSYQYHRPGDIYAPGRHAPPEGSEYMDTSGSGQTFLKFTRSKKVGANWVEVSEEELAKKIESAKLSAELRRLGFAEKADPQEMGGGSPDELNEEGCAPPDARTTRLARRARGPSSVKRTQKKNTPGARGSRGSQREKEKSLDRASDEDQEPHVELTPNSSTPIANGTESTTDDGSGATQENEAEEQTRNRSIDNALETTAMDTRRTEGIREAGTRAGIPFTYVDEKYRTGEDGTAESGVSGPEVAVGTQPSQEIASCISWEDAYMTSASSGRDVAIGRRM